jgi:hypothetical protein
MSDTELSSTSSEDEKPVLTAAEKGKQTRARKRAEEQVKEAKLHAETGLFPCHFRDLYSPYIQQVVVRPRRMHFRKKA